MFCGFGHFLAFSVVIVDFFHTAYYNRRYKDSIDVKKVEIFLKKACKNVNVVWQTCCTVGHKGLKVNKER